MPVRLSGWRAGGGARCSRTGLNAGKPNAETVAGSVHGMTTNLEIAATQSSMPTGPTSFLRSGDGWTTRLGAARQGRRYVPRGGHLVDFGSLPAPRSSTTVSIRAICPASRGAKEHQCHTFSSRACRHASAAVTDPPKDPARDTRSGARGVPALPGKTTAGAGVVGTGNQDTHPCFTAGRTCGDDCRASPQPGPALPEERPFLQARRWGGSRVF